MTMWSTHLVEQLLCYPEMPQMVLHSCGVVLQQGVGVAKGVARLTREW